MTFRHRNPLKSAKSAYSCQHSYQAYSRWSFPPLFALWATLCVRKLLPQLMSQTSFWLSLRQTRQWTKVAHIFRILKIHRKFNIQLLFFHHHDQEGKNFLMTAKKDFEVRCTINDFVRACWLFYILLKCKENEVWWY